MRRTKGTRVFSRSRPRRPSSGRGRSADLDRYRSFIPDWSRFVEALARPEPTVVRARTGRIGVAELRDRLTALGFRLRTLDGLAGFLQIEDGPRPVSFTLEHWLGLLYVQQASTGLAAAALAPSPGDRVLDLCAAPGGKATHLADLMGDRGLLVAADIDDSRIRALVGNLNRLGHHAVLVVSMDGKDFPEGATFDRVLVDAPCSGEGTLRRSRGRIPDQSPSFRGYVTRVQEALLRKAVRLTRPGGRILYATCTFAPEENEAVVTRVLADAPVELEPLAPDVPHEHGLAEFEGVRYDPRLEGAVRVYPHHFDSGGLFMAGLRRLNDGSEDAKGGWTRVPSVFPGEGADGEADVAPLIDRAVTLLVERYGVDRAALDGASWIARGGRFWIHGAEEWPVEAWGEAAARVHALGIRAFELDPRGEAKPTNDLLRWLGRRITRGSLDVDHDGLLRLLDGDVLPGPPDLRGSLALRHQSEVLGRGAASAVGVRSEIPKQRALELRAVLGRTQPLTSPFEGS